MRGKRSKAKWSWRLGALLVGFVAFGGSVAVASIPDGNTINTCRKLPTGTLRVIDRAAGQASVSGEARLDWTHWKRPGPRTPPRPLTAPEAVSTLVSPSSAPVPTPPATRPTRV